MIGKPIRGEDHFQGKDGTRLYYQYWKPEKTRGVLIGVHGAGGHSGRYVHVAMYFAKEGLALYALDHRGHGHSEGIRGHVNSFDEYLYDLNSFIELVRKKEKTKQFFLLGHSLGGLISLAYALKFPQDLSGVVVSSSALKLRMKVSRGKLFFAKMFSRILPKLKMKNEVNPEHLSHDKKVVEDYVADELVHDTVTTRASVEILKAMEDTRKNADKLEVPCFIMHAEDDLLVSPEGSREFHERVRIRDKKLKIYEGYYHELFNEIGNEEVLRDVKEWLLPRIKG